ncbi:MAG: hypothetical protein HXX11_20780, partial [Desulfuromonadales bacterium]|nr:hypothetical protein [Desulfuromonadales bacterium]
MTKILSPRMMLLLVPLLLFVGNAFADTTMGDVVISANTTWPEDTYQVTSLTVNNGATLSIAGGSTIHVTETVTVSGNATILLQGKNNSAQVGGQWAGVGGTINAANVTVDAGSKITADGQGYITGCGPGGAAVSAYTSGGSYGGKGGGSSGPTYGSALAPTDLGSAGGAYGPAWSAGGGAIRLIVSGTLTNNGVVSANGTQDLANGYYTGGGSGGSIYATVGILAGSGIFTANGTSGNSQFASPDGGGGGRVAIYNTASSGFNSNTVTANAGNAGATAGSVYLLENNRNLYVSGKLDFPSAVTLSYENLAISNGALFSLAGGSTVTISNSLSVVGNSTLLLQGKNASTQVDGHWEGVGVTINAANITVDAGSKISADGQGYVTGSGPGGAAASDYASGGSYGGKGGGTHSGPTYGSTFAPTDLGSAGGAYGGGWSAGGGAIRLIVSGALINNGAISANGTQNAFSTGLLAGGASGGSIYATVGTLAGSGSFSANGCIYASVYTANAGGGGGRVAIYYITNNGFDLAKVTANPEYGGTAGSVYTFANGPGNGALTVSDNLVLPDNYVVNLATLTINNGANLTFGNDSVITVDSIAMSAASNFRIGGGSTVTAGNIQITGNSTMTLQGKNTSAKIDGAWQGLGVTINATNIQVDAGSKISADGQGYVTGSGPGGATDISDYASGGSYGGKGGGTHSGPTYGSALAPTEPGSGGGSYGGGWSAGGGAIRLIVSGALINNGAISANGTQNAFTNGVLAGGASGGSIYATVGTLAGSGSFSANGGIYGSYYTANAGGGGGRVAIYYTANNLFDLTKLTANPAKGGTAGTIVISGILEYAWLKPAGETVHGTVRLEWSAFSANTQMTVDVIASSNGRVYTIGSRLPRSSGTDWDSTAVPDGTYELRLIFRDGAGLVMGEGARRVLINNSVVWHSGTVSTDQTWTADKVHVIEGTLIIPSGVHVTISPGTVIKTVKGGQIIVESGGIFDALGTNGAPIVFTSLADDSVGGDTNLDGTKTRAIPGDWLGISVQGSGQFNRNSNTVVRYVMTTQGGTLVADYTCQGSQLLHVTDNIVVPSGVTFTIMPGAVIKFDQNMGITVQTGGLLLANGTAAQPIYFTSIKDDTVGGDTNGDGNATIPSIGDWSRIYVSGAASLDHAVISYGSGTSNSGMITSVGTLTVNNCMVMNSLYDGIASLGGTAIITNSIVMGTDRAINEHGGVANVTNCTIDSNRVGIWGFSNLQSSVTNSIVTNSASAGFQAGAAAVNYNVVWNPLATSGNGSYAGTGNISADPKYRNRLQLDYRLNFGSPAIDAADGTATPVTDFMGAPRYTDPRSPHTGIATTTGAFADMGALEFVETADSAIDLVVSGISGPASAMVGSQAQLSWTVTNTGSGNAVGPWHDAVYLVRNPDTTPVEIFAGEILVGRNTILGPGQSLTATATISVPGSVTGNHRWEVRTNIKGEVFEGKNNGNNSGTSAGLVVIDLSELTVNGSTLSGQFTAVGQSAWYKIEPVSGKDVDVMLALSGGSGDMQLYIGQGYIPDPQHFDIKQNQWNSSNPTALISNTSSQTYYVTAYAGSFSATPADFSISAKTLNFSVTTVQPGWVSNNGNVTFEITGGQLSFGAVYGLVGPNGTVYRPLSVFTKDSSDVFVTFNLNGLATGSYGIQVTKNGATVTDPNAVNVNSGASGTSQIEYDLIVPQAVRAGGRGKVTVTYKNAGNSDAIAPLMRITAVGAKLMSDNGFYLVRTFNSESFLGINQEGPAGILPPGASGSITFDMKPTIIFGSIDFNLDIDKPTEPIPWNLLENSSKPSFVSVDAWDALFTNMKTSIGSTMGQFNAALAADATYLSSIGKYESKVSNLLTFELIKAGLTTIIPRYAVGAFGRGASHAFDIWGAVEDGNIVLHYPVARVRLLIPDSTTSGQFIGSIGDNGALAVNSSDQSWDLTEKNGTLLHFKVDPNNANNHVIDYIQDLNGNRVTVNYTESKVTGVTRSTGDTEQFSYNIQGRIIQTTDEVGRVTTYSYDETGEHLLTVTNTAGTTSFAYITGQGAAQEHAVQSIAYPDGTHRYFEYDTMGRLSKQFRDGGAEKIDYAYNLTGEVIVTDSLGNMTHLLPTNSGQIGQFSDP